MAEKILQRIVMPLRRRLAPLYYRSEGAAFPLRKRNRRAIVLRRGTVLRTDTWFNAFFEQYWRENTTTTQHALRLRISGMGTLRVYRRFSDQPMCLLQEIDYSGLDRELLAEFAEKPQSSVDFGLLFFEMEAHSSRVVMHQAEWFARDVKPQSARLVAAFCTFNRASQLIR